MPEAPRNEEGILAYRFHRGRTVLPTGLGLLASRTKKINFRRPTPPQGPLSTLSSPPGPTKP